MLSSLLVIIISDLNNSDSDTSSSSHILLIVSTSGTTSTLILRTSSLSVPISLTSTSGLSTGSIASSLTAASYSSGKIILIASLPQITYVGVRKKIK